MLIFNYHCMNLYFYFPFLILNFNHAFQILFYPSSWILQHYFHPSILLPDSVSVSEEVSEDKSFLLHFRSSLKLFPLRCYARASKGETNRLKRAENMIAISVLSSVPRSGVRRSFVWTRLATLFLCSSDDPLKHPSQQPADSITQKKILLALPDSP